MSDDMEKKRAAAEFESMLKSQMVREKMQESLRNSHRLIGPEAIAAEMAAMRDVIDMHNRGLGTSMRLSIPFLDAMIFCLEVVPQKLGTDIMSRPAYANLFKHLYAMKQELMNQRDAAIPPPPPLSP